ncbi:MAG: heavy metal translocating P-type ATPase, partial [Eubacteriales bacterium]|nr:heavy metal translocating P-type ATPase [Eubacteriales bacterium]
AICQSIESETQVIAPATARRGKHIQRVYTVQNLGCAHCAAEMAHQIGQLDGVDDCVLVYETKQLRVTGADPDALLPQIRAICQSIESETQVIAPEAEQVHSTSHPLRDIAIGAGLFLVGEALLHGAPKVAVMLAAYLLLGWRVLRTAVVNIRKGRVFDENFLMAVATVGAWAIGSFDEAVGVMLFYRVGEYFEDRAVERSRRQIMDAVDLRPETVQLLGADGSVRTVPAEQAAVGDLLLVRPGDRVPLDGEVVEGESRLDTSAVTGEPVPVRVTVGDRAVSGCVNTDGVLKLRVTHVLAESMVQRILDSVENAAARKPKLDRFITRFSRVYTPVVVAIAALTALLPSLFTGDWQHWVYTALSFLVISCPCALVLSVPLTYFAGI